MLVQMAPTNKQDTYLWHLANKSILREKTQSIKRSVNSFPACWGISRLNMCYHRSFKYRFNAL